MLWRLPGSCLELARGGVVGCATDAVDPACVADAPTAGVGPAAAEPSCDTLPRKTVAAEDEGRAEGAG